MPELLKNLTSLNEDFKYHGLDMVEETISKSNEKYITKYKNWKFTLFDLKKGILPNDYDLIVSRSDLIVSRDALQHLSLYYVYQMLKSFADVNNAKYLLVGSYLDDIQNKNNFLINLSKPPFNLDQYIEIFKEKNDDLDQKYLILYDIPNYLSKVNFEKIKTDVLKFQGLDNLFFTV